jgi:translation initiation factor 1A
MGGKKEEQNIRIPLLKEQNNEMFAVVEQVLGGSRMNVQSADGKSRMARIPGGKKRRIRKIKTRDLLIVYPWDIQDEKADILHKYKGNQARFLSEKDFVPGKIDIFQK